jgi:CubicO group peptidase (beta-lactamase class C family)
MGGGVSGTFAPNASSCSLVRARGRPHATDVELAFVLPPANDLRKFVPKMHSFDPPIRIRDMVRCRSGLWDQVSLPILVGWENAPLQYPHTEADFLSLLAGQKTLPFQPGARFAYSSGDYFLLGLIVKRVSGQSLAQFARKGVFEPLGMSRTFFEEDPTRVVEQRAVGHYKRDGDAWHLWRLTAYWVGGGGLNTCVEDLHRWDQNFARNRLPRGKYLDEFLREGTLLGNRSCLDVDAYLQETDPEARGDSPPGQ